MRSGFFGPPSEPSYSTRRNFFRTLKLREYPLLIYYPLTDGLFSALLGQNLLYLSINGTSPEFRRAVVSTVATLTSQEPELLHRTILAAFTVHLTREKPPTKTETNGEEGEKIVNKDARLPALFLACGAFNEDYETAKRESLIAQLVIVGHHPSLCACHCHASWVCRC